MRLLCTTTILLALTLPAAAAPITLTTDFRFDSFEILAGTPASSPFPEIAGSMTLSFETSADVFGASVDAISFSTPGLSLPTSDVRFNFIANQSLAPPGYLPGPRPANNYLLDVFLVQPGAADDDPGVRFGVDDFLFRLAGLNTNALGFDVPGAGQLLYSEAGIDTIWFTNGNDFASTITLAFVPTPPAPVALLASMLLVAARRRTPR